MPSSSPTMKTTGNSSPLAACRVRSETRSARGSKNSASVVSAAASNKRARSLPHETARVVRRCSVHPDASRRSPREVQPFGGGAQCIGQRDIARLVAELLQQRADVGCFRQRHMRALLEGHAGAVEGLAQGRGLRVGAVEHGEIGKRPTVRPVLRLPGRCRSRRSCDRRSSARSISRPTRLRRVPSARYGWRCARACRAPSRRSARCVARAMTCEDAVTIVPLER